MAKLIEKIKLSFLEELKNSGTDISESALTEDIMDQKINEILLTEEVLEGLSDKECEAIYSFIEPVPVEESFIQNVMKAIQESEKATKCVNKHKERSISQFAFSFRKDEKKVTDEDSELAQGAIEKFLADLDKEGE